MKVRELVAILTESGVEQEEEIIVVIDDGAEHLDELEEGSILSIEEVGGWNAMARARTIRVLPK